MRGTVKWFSPQKGYGFIKGSDGEDVFVHYGNISMDGFKKLEGDDIVKFELGDCDNGRGQAVNVKPILTREIIRDALKKEGLYVNEFRDAYGGVMFYVVDGNNVIQNGEQGMDFLELAEYAGLNTEELT